MATKKKTTKKQNKEALTKARTRDVPTKKKKAAAKAEAMKLPALDIRTLRVGIKQLEPEKGLIVHAWSKKAIKQIEDKQQGVPAMKKAPKNPKAEFEGAKYLNERGKDCIEAHFFKKAIVKAARFADNMKMTHLRGAIFVCGGLIPLKFDKCKMRTDMVRVGGGGKGTADVRYRPEYLGWKVEIMVEYNANVLSDEEVINLLRVAGFSIGLCEWRPECEGDHGRFTIDYVHAAGRRAA